jgi:hypothetical protein
MSHRSRAAEARFRIGRVSVFFHHGNWWVYYRQRGRPHRRRIGNDRSQAERTASLINADLLAETVSTPTALSPAKDRDPGYACESDSSESRIDPSAAIKDSVRDCSPIRPRLSGLPFDFTPVTVSELRV